MAAVIERKSPVGAGLVNGIRRTAYAFNVLSKHQKVKVFDKETVREALPITKVLCLYGMDANQAGFFKCPWHEERTASAKIFKDRLHCFGCGQQADIFGLIQHFERCDFKWAVTVAAAMAGITSSSGEDVSASIERRKRVRDAENARKAASEHKYRLLADIARLSRRHASPYMDEVLSCA